jgi:hypothetical protein
VCHTRARRRSRRPGRGEARRGKRRAGEAGFCHSIHIITGVSLFYVGGGLIARVSPVTVYSRLVSWVPPQPLRFPVASIYLGVLRQSLVPFASERHHIFRCSLVSPSRFLHAQETGRVGLRNACRLRVHLFG